MSDIERPTKSDFSDFSADTVQEDAVDRDACVPCEDLRYSEDSVLRCIALGSLSSRGFYPQHSLFEASDP